MEEVNNDNLVWLIKDNHGNFTNRNGIGRSGIDTWLYVSYKTYDQGVMGNVLKQNAIDDLEHLNIIRDITNMEYAFHIEHLNRRELVLERRKLKGRNIVCFEKKVTTSLNEIVNF